MKSISELSQLEGRVYVYFSSTCLCKAFLKNAEQEGFTFCDGTKPTSKHSTNILAINKDKTLNYVGFIGRILYGAGTEKVENEAIIRVDYDQYLNK